MVLLRGCAALAAAAGDAGRILHVSADNRSDHRRDIPAAAAVPRNDLATASPALPANLRETGKIFGKPLTDSPLCSIIKLYPYRKQKNKERRRDKWSVILVHAGRTRKSGGVPCLNGSCSGWLR